MADKYIGAAVPQPNSATIVNLILLAVNLEPDSQRVLLRIAERLKEGQKQYGPLDLERDVRDYLKDAVEEDLDGAIYRAMHLLREERKKTS